MSIYERVKCQFLPSSSRRYFTSRYMKVKFLSSTSLIKEFTQTKLELQKRNNDITKLYCWNSYHYNRRNNCGIKCGLRPFLLGMVCVDRKIVEAVIISSDQAVTRWCFLFFINISYLRVNMYIPWGRWNETIQVIYIHMNEMLIYIHMNEMYFNCPVYQTIWLIYQEKMIIFEPICQSWSQFILHTVKYYSSNCC